MRPVARLAKGVAARAGGWARLATLALLAVAAAAAAVVVAAGIGGEPATGDGAEAARAPSDSGAGRLSQIVLARVQGRPTVDSPGSRDSAEERAAPTPGPSFIWPVDGWIAQGMTARHPTGIDIAVDWRTPVRAVRAGRVVFAGGDPCCEYGHFVIIEHDRGWSSLYGHLDSFTVTLGKRVTQGQVIGHAGATGKANGPHLHFELRAYGLPVSPFGYLQPYRSPPPPETYAAAPAEDEPGAGGARQPPPAPTAPRGRGSGLQREEAIALAVQGMTSDADAAYAVDLGSCSATRTGPNWSVTCSVRLQGCTGSAACYEVLTACVLEQPLLVAATC